jgi:hypothetical protein
MAVGVRVLRSVHGADLEDALEPAGHRHLLVQLRRLRQARRLAALVVQPEHRGASFAGPRYQFRRVDAVEAFAAERLHDCLFISTSTPPEFVSRPERLYYYRKGYLRVPLRFGA